METESTGTPTGETRLALVRRARRINRILAETYPYAVAELDFETLTERERRARVEQRPRPVGPGLTVGKEFADAFGVEGQVNRLHRRRHAEVGKARRVVRVQVLGVLEARPQPPLGP